MEAAFEEGGPGLLAGWPSLTTSRFRVRFPRRRQMSVVVLVQQRWWSRSSPFPTAPCAPRRAAVPLIHSSPLGGGVSRPPIPATGACSARAAP
eukprot:5844079-Alexandrium_andersonii.AAC.1